RSRQASVCDVGVGPTLTFRKIHDQLAVTDRDKTRPFAAELGRRRFAGLPLVLVVGLALLLGAAGKSAQLPLHVWLPDAMAGPTPVSALIHAATMVTAGLYMVTRTNVIFQHSQTMMMVVALVGAATALFAATIGITQNDIKK